MAKRIEEASLEIYELVRHPPSTPPCFSTKTLRLTCVIKAHAYALSRGIIIADTKFEFGLDPVTNELILIDEVLTPDSSRCWPKEQYEVGKAQSSYDKQYLRDWLTREGLKGKEGVAMPEAVVRETERKYREAMEMLMK